MTTAATHRERMVEAMIALENQFGQITPEQVVEAAADPTSPLHRHFEWNDEIAAHGHRIDQARALLRSVRVQIGTIERSVNVVRYVHDSGAEKEQGYRSLINVMQAGLAETTVDAEVARTTAIIARGREIARALNRETEYLAAVGLALV